MLKWCVFLLVLVAVQTVLALSLVENGKSAYHIIIPATALPSEKYAAEELQHYLQRISGAVLPIAPDTDPLGAKEVLLGSDNAHLRLLGAAGKVKIDPINMTKLGTDGFSLRTIGDYLVILGGKPRGTLYGVYGLLEDHLGVHWYTPEVEDVPQTTHIVLPPLNDTQVPAFEYREDYWSEVNHNPIFAARRRLNGPSARLDPKQGGPAVVYYPFVHSMDELIPQELFKDHPEYFPMIHGKRVNGYVQRCLSNMNMTMLAVSRVRQWIKEHPEANIISVSQNDTGNWCQCDQCKALDDAEGSPSASLISFVNAIAADIEHDYPNIRIDTLAYQYTRKPPATLRPHKNVIVRLCSFECCFAHPLESCPSEANRRFCEDIKAWQATGAQMYVWDYCTNFAHYQQPFPNFDVLQANLHFFALHGVKGIFEEGNYSAGGGGEMEPLRTYILAKLLWNPELDVQSAMRDFTRGYYGNAATPMRQYLYAMHAPVEELGYHLKIYDPPSAPYFNDDTIKEADGYLDKAEQAAENDDIRFRVQVARLPLWYVKLSTSRVTGDERSALLNRFLEIARKAKIDMISEDESLEHWAKRMGIQ